MDNGKKEFAEDGWECDYTSKAFKKYCIPKRGVSRYIKKKMSKRFRSRGKLTLKKEEYYD